MPAGEIEREEAARQDRRQPQPAPDAAEALPRSARDQEQERDRQREPPEARGDRSDIGEPDEPRSDREHDIAEDQRGERPARRHGSVNRRCFPTKNLLFEDRFGQGWTIGHRAHIPASDGLSRCKERPILCRALRSHPVRRDRRTQPRRDGAAHPRPLDQGARADRADDRLLPPARVGRPDHHRGDRDQPGRARLALCAGAVDRRAGRGSGSR